MPLARYTGSPLQMERVLFKARHSLIDQSLHAAGRHHHQRRRLRAGLVRPPGARRLPGAAVPLPQRASGLERPQPARGARAIHSSLFVAHIRAATDTPAQETNCHPFRHGNWLFVHNGLIRDFPLLRRDLMLMIAPAYFGSLEGSTDSELMFLLALSFGLEDDPLPALARMVGRWKRPGAAMAWRSPST